MSHLNHPATTHKGQRLRPSHGLTWVLVASLALWATSAYCDTLAGKVVAVADGDTLTVLDGDKHQHHVRLSGIDAPEKHQAFGSKAREHLAALTFQRDAVVEYRKRDRYGRIVGKVEVEGRDVGLAQVEAGMAWHYKQFSREQLRADRLTYAAAENSARAARRGLWADEDPTPPWEFRGQSKAR
ncbi:thermonuclease family protein [Roseateles sp. NT4]|uniref:thermonuclease family protein n=1 Tax=Roseateles sp. NT4 TaxID=3453715 RepID=UPI003EEB70E5